jgi:hypothetical protein
MKFENNTLHLDKLTLPRSLRCWFFNQKNWQGIAINLNTIAFPFEM